MSTSFSVLLLLAINLGLIWLLIAAPIGRRTLRLTRVFSAPPGRIAALVNPLGAEADWHPSVLSSDRLADNRVRQTFSYPDRRGEPITRTLAVNETSDAAGLACETRVVEDSALDVSGGSFTGIRASSSARRGVKTRLRTDSPCQSMRMPFGKGRICAVTPTPPIVPCQTASPGRQSLTTASPVASV